MTGDECRLLIRRCRTSALATALDAEKWPYASLVTVACDTDGSPLLLLSELSAHTQNIARDDRASLLFEAASRLSNPQSGPRATLVGRINRTDDDRLRRRFLARHPGAHLYAKFKDFQLYRMAVERAHLIGGFARAQWAAADDVILESGVKTEIGARETPFLEKVNDENAQAIQIFVNQVLRRPGSNWAVAGIDADGCDFRRGNTFARLDFSRPVRTWSKFECAVRQVIVPVEIAANKRKS